MVSRVSPACIEVFAVVDQRHLQWAFDVRQEVFVVEQGYHSVKNWMTLTTRRRLHMLLR